MTSPSLLRARALLLAPLLAALCTACGPGGPKRDTGNDNGGGTPTRSTGITIVAGNATLAGGADAQGTAARFNTPRGIVVDGAGNLYVADQLNYAIRKIATDGTVSTFAGALGAQLTSGNGDGNGNRARFSSPTAIAIDGSGNLFVLDGFAVRKITPSADVSTVATLPSGSGFGTSMQFVPAGIAVDKNGNLFVTTSVDTRRLAASNYRSTTLESGLAFDYSQGVDVLAPRGITVDSSGVAWEADLGNTISKIPVNASVPTRFAGVQGTIGNVDGNAGTARYGQVVALTVDGSGNLYAADAINGTVRKITSNAVTSTVAGRAGNGVLVEGGLPGSLATLRGITVDAANNLYVSSGNAIVKIAL